MLHERGLVASETRVGRLCSENRILSGIHRRRGTGKKAGPPVHDDHVRRDFTARAPNKLWLTDITEHSFETGAAGPHRAPSGGSLQSRQQVLQAPATVS